MQRTEEPTHPMDTLTREQADAASQRAAQIKNTRDNKGHEGIGEGFAAERNAFGWTLLENGKLSGRKKT